MNIKLTGKILLKSSLSHIGETIGNQSLLRRENIIQEDGSIEDVFVYSGNAIRGQLRDCGFLYFLEKLGIKKLTLESFYFLFSGGALTDSGTTVDIGMAQEMRKVIPLIAVFGGAIGNQIMPGKINCNKAYPIVEECRRLLPQEFQKKKLPSWRHWIGEEEYTRTDDAKNHNLKHLIETTEEDKDRNPQQMRYSVEVLSGGAELYHEIRLNRVTDLEYGAFVSALHEFSKNPYFGGKSGIGHGQVELHYNKCKIGINIAKTDKEMEEAKALYDNFLEEYKKYLSLSETGKDVRKMIEAKNAAQKS